MQANQITAFLSKLESTADQLDGLLRTVGYEKVSEALGMSSSVLPEQMKSCVKAIASLSQPASLLSDAPGSGLVQIQVSEDDDKEVEGASIPEDQLAYLLATHGKVPVVDQHGEHHRLMTDMDGESLVLLPAEDQVEIRLVLDVVYEPNGLADQELIDLLNRNTLRAIGNGMLGGDSPAEVNFYALSVS